MKRLWAVVLIFVAGLGAGGLAVWAVSDNDSDSGGTSLSAKDGNSSSTPAKELVDRLGKGKDATYHVRFAAGDETGAHVVLEVWHTADRVRRDVDVTGSTESTRTQEFLQDGKYVRCALVQDHPWQCVAADATQANLQDPIGGGTGANLLGKDVAVTNETIAGHDAKCYKGELTSTATTIKKPAEVCLSAENVPLRITGSDGKTTEATDYDTKAPGDSVFKYPATVAGLNPSSNT